MQFLQSGAVAVASQFHYLVAVLACELVEYRLFLLHLHLSFHLLQFRFLVGLSPDDIKLASAALALRVHLVAETGGAQRTTLMEELRIHELCRYGIVRSAGSQILSCRCTFAVGVAALDHEILYHSMKQSSVEISFLGELYEVVAMFWGLVVEAHEDVA